MKNLWNTIVYAIQRFFSLIFERFGKKKAILLIVSGSVVLLSAIITPFFFIFGEDEPDDPHTCVGITWVIDNDATCRAEGSKRFVCSCGKTVKTEKIPLAHNMENGVCTECGYSCIEIRTVEDLQNVASNLRENYILLNDLDLSGMEWIPIGTSSSNCFTGTFDGNGHVIENFKITGDVKYAGLFGYNKGTIKNLGLESFTIDVSDSYDAYAGGLVGWNVGTITNCYATGDVSASSNDSADAGGLVGYNSGGTITNCYATGDVSASSNDSADAGGLVGANNDYNGAAIIANCYATGDVSSISANGNAEAGGLAGYQSGAIMNCYATGDVSSTCSNNDIAYAGGLVARSATDGIITNCYATGDVSASTSSSSAYAGGLVGENYSSYTIIKNCYSYSGQRFVVTKNGVTTYEATNTEEIEISIESLQSKAWVEENLWKSEIDIWSFGVGYPTLDYDAMQSVVEISKKEDFLKLQDGALVRDYKLMANIDLGDMEWQPIAMLLGSFDGNGHVISNFKITGSEQYAGLFGYSCGTIQNLGVEGFTIDINYSYDVYAGGLVGKNYEGTITNCYAMGDVSSTRSGDGDRALAGGLIGLNEGGAITNCYATGNVNSSDTESDIRTYVYAGGLVGYNGSDSVATNNGSITNCYATGGVSSTSSDYALAGGLIGANTDAIMNSYATGDVSSTGSYRAYAGGLAGANGGAITNCYATGDVSATGSSAYVGGLVGDNDGCHGGGIIANCYATGDVNCTSSGGSAYAGGLVGDNNGGTITNCYAIGNVSSTSSGYYAYAGGLIGYNNDGIITNCYATGDVSASSNDSAYAGGLIGYNNGGIITNCYATGDVGANSTNDDANAYAYAGGLVGYNDGTITNCYCYSGQSFTVATNDTTTYEATNTYGVVTSIENLQSKEWVKENLWKAEIETWNFSLGSPTLDYDAIDALKQSVVEISTKEELLKLQAGGLLGNYKLMADINLGGMEWTPIAVLVGTFDGNGHVISNFKITGDVQYAGLFGRSYGTIQNLGVESFTVDVSCSDTTYASGLVGYNDGTITNCYAMGDVSATGSSAYAGGLVGLNYGNITNCYATGNVSSTSSSNAYAGGLIGYNYGTITNCYATGDVSTSTSFHTAIIYAGGLVGKNSGTITNCYATGDVSASSTGSYYSYTSSYSYAGGLVGKNSGTITNCYATGDVSASARYPARAGGLVGDNGGTITNCYATGDVSASSTRFSAYAGGLAGYNYGTITDCYATGDVSASANSAYAGGLVGGNYASGLIGGNYSTITNCYATGKVKSKSSNAAYAGGLVGYNDGGTTKNCYRYSGQSFTVTENGMIKHSSTNTLGTATDMPTLQSVSFQQNTLGWSADDWDFAEGAHPTLKNVGFMN